MSTTLRELMAKERRLVSSLDAVRQRIVTEEQRLERDRRAQRKLEWLHNRILRDVMTVTGVGRDAIDSRSRRHEDVWPRWAVWWLLREIAELSYQEVGVLVGRDHSTIINAVRQVQASPAWPIVLAVFELNSQATAAETRCQNLPEASVDVGGGVQVAVGNL